METNFSGDERVVQGPEGLNMEMSRQYESNSEKGSPSVASTLSPSSHSQNSTNSNDGQLKDLDTKDIIVEIEKTDPTNINIDDKDHKIEIKTEEQPKTMISNMSAFLYLTKLSLGTGILAYPIVIEQCGVIPFVIIAVIFCVWVNIMTFRLNDVYYKVKTSMKADDSPYPAVSRIILGKYGEKIFTIVFIISMAGVGCVYSVTGAELIGLLRWDKIGASFLYKNTRFILIPFYLFLSPFLYLSNVSYLSFTNIIALSSIGISVLILVIYGLTSNEFAIQSINWVKLSSEGFSKGVGTLAFTFPFAQINLSCVSSMKTPNDYNKISISSSIALFIIYLLFGVVEASSFIKTDEGVQGNILASVNSESVSYYFITILMFILCILSIPNVMMVVFEIVDRKHTVGSYFVKDLPTILIRTLLLISIFVVSVAIPRFDILVSLLGNLTISSISFILPGALHYVLFKDSTRYMKITNLLSVFLGTVLLIYTTVQTIIDIAK